MAKKSKKQFHKEIGLSKKIPDFHLTYEKLGINDDDELICLIRYYEAQGYSYDPHIEIFNGKYSPCIKTPSGDILNKKSLEKVLKNLELGNIEQIGALRALDYLHLKYFQAELDEIEPGLFD